MTVEATLLSLDEDAQLNRLLELRNRLSEERAEAMSPAVERALRLADVYLFLALGYFGYSDRLVPEQDAEGQIPVSDTLER